MHKVSVVFIILIVPVLAAALYAANVVPRSGTSAQIAATAGTNGEIAVDNSTKQIVIFDGKKKGGYYTTGSTVTVVNTYNSYPTSNTINNTYNYGIINSTDTYYFAPDLRTYLHFDGIYVTMVVNGVEYDRWGAEAATEYIYYAGNQVTFNGNKLRY